MSTPTATAPVRCERQHMLHRGCISCVAQALSMKTLRQVTIWYEQGMISTAAFDGYKHVWAISAERSDAYRGWMVLPDTEEGREYARHLHSLIPSGRGYC